MKADETTAPSEISRPHLPGFGLYWLREYGIVISFVLLFAVLTFSSNVFLTSTNLLNVLETYAPVGIIAIATTYVLIAGEFDLSVGAIYMLTGVLAAMWVEPLGPWVAILAAIAAAGVMGLINGLLITYAKIDSFICTLATSLMIAGAGVVITEGFTQAVVDPTFSVLGMDKLFGVRYSIWLFAAIAVIAGVVLARTKFGRWTFAVGGNQEAARLSGINTRMVRLSTFVMSGTAAGIAGAIVASRSSQGQAGDGLSITLFVFAAIVVGGTSMHGGRGSIWRTVLGVLFLALIVNGFTLLGVQPVYQQVVQGAIILIAVAADSLSRRTSS